MKKKVLNYIKENKMLESGDSVVLGVSGGADSLCMLCMLHELSPEFDLTLTVIHVNHNIRGQEAMDDQRFVEEFCKKIGVKCITVDIWAKKLAKEWKCSEEEAGRIARYDIFNRTLNEINADKIAIAHNLNDNSETVLFNLFRGSGIKGLAGIAPVRENIIRPVLCLTRDEIEEYLKEKNIEYRTDSTNLATDYTRNKMRNIIIPYIESSINTNVSGNITRASGELRQIEDYLKIQSAKAYEASVQKINNGYLINNSAENLHIVLKKRIIRSIINELSGKLKDVTLAHVEIVLRLFEMQTGSKADLPYGIKATRQYEGVYLYIPKIEDESKHLFKEQIIYKKGMIFENDIVKLDLDNKEISQKNVQQLRCTKWIDCDMIKDTLVLRTRQTGDFITIDDNGRTKKLKDYFINEKIPQQERDKILLIADGHSIVWVLGHRIGSSYKITDKTTNVMKITWKENI